jgi:predicted neuraminidase
MLYYKILLKKVFKCWSLRLFTLSFTVFLSILLICAGLILTSSRPDKPRFWVKDSWATNSLQVDPLFESYIIPQPHYLRAAHSSAFDVLPNGDLLATWFAGSHEGKPDVKIWQSEFANGSWSMARSIVSPQSLSKDTGTYIKKVGNPVIYRAKNGKWHLFVVSVSAIGGWSGSRIDHLISKDNAQTWLPAQKLILSPFFNISTLERTRPLTLKDGGFYLPVYHELLFTYPELIRFDSNGKFIKLIRLNTNTQLLQPTLVPTSEFNAMVFFRNKTWKDESVYMQTTNDGGVSWSQPVATTLTNRDSSLVVAKVGDDALLMVHNIGPRSYLALDISHEGKTWQHVAVLENTPEKEFSYPSIQVHNGIVDILYTWDRKSIKHVRFNLAWLRQQEQRVNPNVIKR